MANGTCRSTGCALRLCTALNLSRADAEATFQLCLPTSIRMAGTDRQKEASWKHSSLTVRAFVPPLFMQSFSVFDRASPALLQWLEIAGNPIDVRAGETLIHEGQRSESLFVLQKGNLSVFTTNQKQGQDRLATLTPGSLLGEMSWLEQRPAVASTTADTECSVLSIPGQALATLGGLDPDLTAELHCFFAQKLALQIQQQNAWAHRLKSQPNPVEALRKVLVLFAKLHEQDVHRLAGWGQLQRLQPHSVLLRQGHPVPALYLILSGEAEILLTLDGNTREVGSSRRGELIGEMSLLLDEQEGAAASVETAQGMDVLAFDRLRLQEALDGDPKLATRFYTGLACMLSQRSRDQLIRHQRAIASQEVELDSIGRLDLEDLSSISRAARHFDWLCKHFQAGEGASA